MKSSVVKAIMIFVIAFVAINTYAQNSRKTFLHGVELGLNFSQIGLDRDNIRTAAPNIAYHSLININRQVALELGLGYQPTYIDGFFHFLLDHLNNNDNRFWASREFQLYHFLDFPVMVSVKTGRRSKDRFFIGANISLPVYQPAIKSPTYYIFPDDLYINDTKYFSNHVEALMGYRFQLEGNSFISVSMAYDVTPAMDEQIEGSIFGNNRFMSFQFSYHYFFDN